jgi:hypothetical protein
LAFEKIRLKILRVRAYKNFFSAKTLFFKRFVYFFDNLNCATHATEHQKVSISNLSVGLYFRHFAFPFSDFNPRFQNLGNPAALRDVRVCVFSVGVFDFDTRFPF